MAMVELERALQLADADASAAASGLVVFDTAKVLHTQVAHVCTESLQCDVAICCERSSEGCKPSHEQAP
jgi:hypothetical protein